MSLRHHEIAEARHRILNPLLEEDLRTIGAAASVGDETVVIDLCSGKGELLCRWAEWYGASGLGVDLSAAFVADARARADELGVADRVRFSEGEAAAWARDRATAIAGAARIGLDSATRADIVSCLGATWIGEGLAGTVALMRPLVRADGLLLVGEPFYEEEPPAEAFSAWGVAPTDFTTLAGTLERFESLGLELVEMVAADARGWERYEAGQWAAVDDWLAANPSDPDHEAMRDFLARGRRAYLAYGRRYLGWAVFVLRLRA